MNSEEEDIALLENASGRIGSVIESSEPDVGGTDPTVMLSDDDNSPGDIQSLKDVETAESQSVLVNGNVREDNTNIDESANSSNSSTKLMSQSALAFTIEFDSDRQVDTAKYQNLFERYAARHKRNLSTSKVEINSKKSEFLTSPSVAQKQQVSSAHSEDYFTSEDNNRRKNDLSEKLKCLDLKTSPINQTPAKMTSTSKLPISESRSDNLMKSFDQPVKNATPTRRNLSLDLQDPATATTSSAWCIDNNINDLNRMQSYNQLDEIEKNYTKNIYIDDSNNYEDITQKVCNISRESNVSYEKECNVSSVSRTFDQNEVSGTDIEIFNVSNDDAASEGAVSAAETYTIDKDYTDEEKARMDIDKVFGVGVLTEEEESNPIYVRSITMNASRDNSTWITEWASQVVEHNSLPVVTNRPTPPISPTKIPSPNYFRSQRARQYRHEQSDSSLDVESFLRGDERLISSTQHMIIDSGGESDEDTSNSYNTPPHSSQRTPVHRSTITRRSSLSDSLFRRTGQSQLGIDKHLKDTLTLDTSLKPPSRTLSYLTTRRSSSLDRNDHTSDANESNTSRNDSFKYSTESKHTNSPIMNRLMSTSKLTNSPVVTRKTSATKMMDTKTSQHAKNIGYFTCTENSPYMLRKSNSTTNYHESSVMQELRTNKIMSTLHSNSEFQRSTNIQRSSSNASIRNAKVSTVVSRHSSFNNSDLNVANFRSRYATASDSSSETGDQQKSSAAQVLPGLRLNRAFGIRRSRLTCGYDATQNTQPIDRTKRAQSEAKTTITTTTNKPQAYRTRASSFGSYSKENVKKEPTKYRTPSISRTDTGRLSMRGPKPSYQQTTVSPRTNQKPIKDHKKSPRSNSTLTSKQVEFQNWKRRKSYDPLKAAAEGRKKAIDSTRKSGDGNSTNDNLVLRSASFHGTGGNLSLANNWSDQEIDPLDNEPHAPPPCSPRMDSDSDLETSSYLQETQNVMSAMSARMTGYRPSLSYTDGESDEDTSQSVRQNATKTTSRRSSDTESSDDRQQVAQPISNTKYNRAVSLRRARLECQPVKPTTITKPKSAPQDTRQKPETISRTDTGRFSMRSTRSSNNNIKVKPKETKKPTTTNTREVEMQNWKRRKSYDPMKAAMEGRKKTSMMKKSANANLSPSHVARSQSFHGSVGLDISDYSEEELVVSADEVPQY